MKKRRILYILSSDHKYGAPKSFMELLLRLKNDYNIIPVVLTCTYGRINEFCNQNNIENYYIKYEAFMIVGGSNIFRKICKRLFLPYLILKYKIKNFFALKKIEKKIDFKKIDLIHTNINRINIGDYFSKKYNIKHIWHIREFGKEDYNCISLENNYIRKMNTSNNYFIAISNAVKKAWADKGISSNKIKVIYNGIDVDKIEFRQKNEIKDNIKIVFAALISETKGQIQLIKAIDLLPEEIKEKIKVDFYGSGRKRYISYLKKEVEKKKLNKIIEFKGYSDKLQEIYKDYNIGVVCSKSEGFGRVTIEYMSAGLFVIASNSGANPELIKKTYGALYEYGNEKDLANKIMEAFNKSVDAKNSRQYVIDNFSSKLNSKNINNLYNNILDEKE